MAAATEKAGSGRVRCMIITGKSGAGMSTVLKSLEDIGYTAVDNLPLGLLPHLLDQMPQIGGPLAVVV
ncbi:MAG: RNase adaptor protein RapZ, partial [Rhodospirillaceae bacterium]|nr:RNase adaptor protein RapZ [Rhodospirillaceae bacterium]